MNSATTPFFFYLLSGLAVVGGLLVITLRKPLHAASALVGTLTAVAGLDWILTAPFVAAVQIVVGAGGIVALFVIVVALTNFKASAPDASENNNSNYRRFNRMWPLGVVAGGALLALLVSSFAKGRELFPDRMVLLDRSSNTQQIATMLYGETAKLGQYTLALEIASLLLLATMVGAIVVAKRLGVRRTDT
jgi:NADH-quinone oxidoreductase subunit J